jgi:hypothetical protein
MKKLISTMKETYPEPNIEIEDIAATESVAEAFKTLFIPWGLAITVWIWLYPIRAVRILLSH